MNSFEQLPPEVRVQSSVYPEEKLTTQQWMFQVLGVVGGNNNTNPPKGLDRHVFDTKYFKPKNQ
jgi:hypothetical protein